MIIDSNPITFQLCPVLDMSPSKNVKALFSIKSNSILEGWSDNIVGVPHNRVILFETCL